ncbi:ankyrin repeat-containing protein [Tanacetum coccineum]|uniref:Ankyrin repeat-containing protein n=1 Tax=Tanacetum coccineum TaxID=301880 RepID=A0ABQ4XHC1_9ASTR
MKQELGAVRSELNEIMKVLSTLKLSNDQSSPKGVNRSNHHRADYRMRKLKMPLFDEEDSHGWIYKVESEARSPFRLWEGLKRRLFERFQLSQEGTLYEQFLAITQEGTAREYIGLFETLARQLVGIPEEVMEGTFIKGLRPELRLAVRVMQPEGLNHAMKLAIIDASLDRFDKIMQWLAYLEAAYHS